MVNSTESQIASVASKTVVVTPEGDDALVLALAGGKSQTAAAELAGVCRDTVYRRMQNPVFRARIEAVRRGWLDRAAGQLADGAVEAVIRLRKIVEDESEATRDQVAAAKALLASLKLAGECPECKRRAEEANRPRTLEEQLAHDAYIEREYKRIEAELADAQRLNAEQEARDLAAWTAAGIKIPNVLCYSNQDPDGLGGGNGAA